MHAASSADTNASANSVAIGLCANRSERDPVIPGFHLIYQQTGMRVHIADHGRDSPVIPKIAHSQSAGGSRIRDAGSSIVRNIRESPISVVVVKNFRLLIIAAQMLLVHFGIKVST